LSTKRTEETLQEWKGCLSYREGYRRAKTLSSSRFDERSFLTGSKNLHERQDSPSSQGRGRESKESTKEYSQGRGRCKRVFTNRSKSFFLQETVSTLPSKREERSSSKKRRQGQQETREDSPQHSQDSLTSRREESSNRGEKTLREWEERASSKQDGMEGTLPKDFNQTLTTRSKNLHERQYGPSIQEEEKSERIHGEKIFEETGTEEAEEETKSATHMPRTEETRRR
jgi:hypothetical protein